MTPATGHTEMHSLARLGAIFEDAARAATERWLTTKLAEHGIEHAVRDGEWGSLLDRTRQAALQGHDLDQLLDRAITMRPVDDAHSIAGLLHWRLGQLAEQVKPIHQPGPLRSLPPLDRRDEHLTFAQAAGELTGQRWHQRRHQLEGTMGPLPYARALGPRPDDPTRTRRWLTAATAVKAYRERFQLADHLQLLGERPGSLRPGAQAAYEHAQLQVDLHLVDSHLHLTPISSRHSAADSRSTRKPSFDPEQRCDAHLAAGSARRQAADASDSWAGLDADSERRLLSPRHPALRRQP
jgi:hypothetical protein